MTMTIQLSHGDLLKQHDVDAIVNTVNCVGVMGKGIALQFKNKWPDNYAAYRAACENKQVRIGRMFVFDAGPYAQPHYIINFPTKDHWKGKSRLEYIREGLVDLVAQIKALGIRSVAMPPLGCGNGGLDWSDVRPLIEAAFAPLPDVDLRLFAPGDGPDPKSMEVRTPRPKMTRGRAAILKLLETYRALNYGLSKIEVQKLAYFLQEAGEDLNLPFVKHEYGPYSDTLRHVLNRMEGHFVHGVGDGVVEAEIEPDAAALEEAEQFLTTTADSALAQRVANVGRLIDGFQTPYGMELLATVHWVATRDGNVHDADEAHRAVADWNLRKQGLMTPDHVRAAWARLESEQWLRPNRG
jgi:O-acetyl-ADP-ribose deacetylase (regulator of RNase III)